MGEVPLVLLDAQETAGVTVGGLAQQARDRQELGQEEALAEHRPLEEGARGPAVAVHEVVVVPHHEMHDDRPDQRGDVLVGEVARPIGEIAEAPHALRQLFGGWGDVEHVVVRLVAVDPDALLAGPLDPARVGGVVQGPLGDDGVHVEDHLGSQRLVLELAHL